MNPYIGYKFLVRIEDITEAGFTEVSGLQVTTQVEDIRQGGINGFVYKLPKETTFDNLILKKGLADADTLWRWHKEVVNGQFTRRRVDIVLMDRVGQEAFTWSFKDAFPIKWVGPELKADSNTVAFESLELVHHGYV